MAKLKVFASGEVLTAEDVNDYLNPEVPDGATAYDTGWVPLNLINGWQSTSSVTPAYRRIGMITYLRGRIGGGSGVAAFIPENAAPGQTWSNQGRNDGSLTDTATVNVLATGAINPSSAANQPNLEMSFPVG